MAGKGVLQPKQEKAVVDMHAALNDVEHHCAMLEAAGYDHAGLTDRRRHLQSTLTAIQRVQAESKGQ